MEEQLRTFLQEWWEGYDPDADVVAEVIKLVEYQNREHGRTSKRLQRAAEELGKYVGGPVQAYRIAFAEDKV